MRCGVKAANLSVSSQTSQRGQAPGPRCQLPSTRFRVSGQGRSRQERASFLWGISEARIIKAPGAGQVSGVPTSPLTPRVALHALFATPLSFGPRSGLRLQCLDLRREMFPLPINGIQATPFSGRNQPGPQLLDRIRPDGRKSADASREGPGREGRR